MIDVHAFDGKLIDIKVPSVSKKVKDVVYETYEYVLQNDQDIKNASFYNDTVEGFKLIKNDTQQAANFDSTNNKYADDIFSNILIKVIKKRDKSLLYTLSEQI